MSSREDGGASREPTRSASARAASVAPSRASSRSSAGFGRSLSASSGPPERRRKAPRPTLAAVTPFRDVRVREDSPSPPASPPRAPSPAAAGGAPAAPRVAAGELRERAEALRAAAQALDRDAAAAERRQGASTCAPGGADWAGLACVSQVWDAAAKLVCAGLWWPAPPPPPPPAPAPRRSSSVAPVRAASRRSMVVAPDNLPPIRTRTSGAGSDVEDGSGAASPETAGKRVAPRLPRSSSAVFSLGDVPAGVFKPARTSTVVIAAPPDEPAREVLPGTAELLRARSLRVPPPPQQAGVGGVSLRSALRAMNAIATPRVLWRHKRAAQDLSQAKENGLLR